MTLDEVLALPGHEPPVLCLDGKFGMLISVPGRGHPECGVQVHGEPDIRWIALAHLTASQDGALRERGARLPPAFDGLVQKMLALEWAGLGGMSIRDEPLAQHHYVARQKFEVEAEPEMVDITPFDSVFAMRAPAQIRIRCLTCGGAGVREDARVRCVGCGETQDLNTGA